MKKHAMSQPTIGQLIVFSMYVARTVKRQCPDFPPPPQHHQTFRVCRKRKPSSTHNTSKGIEVIFSLFVPNNIIYYFSSITLFIAAAISINFEETVTDNNGG